MLAKKDSARNTVKWVLVLLVMTVLAGCGQKTGVSQATVSPTDTVTESPLNTPTMETQTAQEDLSTETPAQVEITPTAATTVENSEPTKLDAPTVTSTPRPKPDPEDWVALPVLPNVSDGARQIYRLGLDQA